MCLLLLLQLLLTESNELAREPVDKGLVLCLQGVSQLYLFFLQL